MGDAHLTDVHLTVVSGPVADTEWHVSLAPEVAHA